jgi:hypothetical protein
MPSANLPPLRTVDSKILSISARSLRGKENLQHRLDEHNVIEIIVPVWSYGLADGPLLNSPRH